MNANEQNAEAVAAFAPETRSFTGAGKEYTVRRLETRQIWPILRCGLPILEGLAGLVGKASSPAETSQGSSASASQPPVTPPSSTPNLDALLGSELGLFTRIMAEHGERVTDIIACALDEKHSQVGRFEPQEMWLACKAIVEVNRDFFTRRVAPMLGLEPGGLTRSALAGAVSQALGSSGAGAIPSSS